MAKYNFERIGSERFETLVQSLLERRFRTGGHLTQFGPGKDGGRDATWSQSPDHPDYCIPEGAESGVPKEWIFQVKFHDVGLSGWKQARVNVVAELERELSKISTKHSLECHKYVLITNVPFSGVRNVGTRDQVNAVIERWNAKVPEIEVWDASDLSRMLDADPDTRTTYLGEILSGDILKQLLLNLKETSESRSLAFRAFLERMLKFEQEARAEEAGDESGLELEKVFVDLDLKLVSRDESGVESDLVEQVEASGRSGIGGRVHVPTTLERVPASFALLRASHSVTLIKGGPGVGKSTLTQFLGLYHAARFVDKEMSKRLAARLKLSGGVTAEELDSYCELRYPLRIELRHFVEWASKQEQKERPPHFAAFFAQRINEVTSSELNMGDVFVMASQCPVLLMLDGLDEVPHPSQRATIFRELDVFLNRCSVAKCDVSVVLSTRPQGYGGEFDRYSPIVWQIVELSEDQVRLYADNWIEQRIPSIDYRADARRRLWDGMQSPAVKNLATTLLQVTVMLTIVRRRHAIPHAKHKLFAKLVEVVFEREEAKREEVRRLSRQLKHLHSLVGYELIRRMGNTDRSGVLSGEDFQVCVLRVLKDYGAGRELDKDLTDVLTLAKDRLCLLAGKGEDQESVDFVIQPYREFFAADYLNSHESADPDLLFTALVDRQHIWGNVLQFYVAFQTNAQQHVWISQSDGLGVNSFGENPIVAVTKLKKAMVRLLPEFDRPKNEFVDRAFRNLMNVDTLWTWDDRGWVAAMLMAFAPEDSFMRLRGVFGALDSGDPALLPMKLDLLALTAGPNNRLECSADFEDLLLKGDFQSEVLSAAARNNLVVNVSSVSLDVARAVLKEMEFQRPAAYLEWWEGLTESQLIEIALSVGFYNVGDGGLYSDSWVVELFTFLNSREFYSVMINGVTVGVPGFYFKVGPEDGETLVKIKSHLENLEDCASANYLRAVVHNIEFPNDIESYKSASELESELGETRVHRQYTVKALLGPHPSEYESEVDWVSARNQVIDLSSQEPSEWLGQANGYFSWLALCVPRNCWGRLSDWEAMEQLVSLEGPILDRLQGLAGPNNGIGRIIGGLDYDDASGEKLSSIVSMQRIMGTHFRVAGWDLLGVGVQSLDISSKMAEDLLKVAEAEDLGPELSCAVLSASVQSMLLDPDRLVEFWRTRCARSTVNVPEYPEETIRALTKRGDMNSLECAASFVLMSRSARKASQYEFLSELSSALSSELARADPLEIKSVRLLVELPVHTDEVDFWCNLEVIHKLQGLPFAISLVEMRMSQLVLAEVNSNSTRLRSGLLKVIDGPSTISREFVVIAINSIHRFDEMCCAPLVERDWLKA